MPPKRQKRTSRIVNRPLNGEESTTPAAKRRAESKSHELNGDAEGPLGAAASSRPSRSRKPPKKWEEAEEIQPPSTTSKETPVPFRRTQRKSGPTIDAEKLDEFIKYGGDDRAFFGRLLSSLDVRTSRIERGEIFADPPSAVEIKEEPKEEVEKDSFRQSSLESDRSKSPTEPKKKAKAKRKKSSLFDLLKEATNNDDEDCSDPPTSTSKLTDLIFSKPLAAPPPLIKKKEVFGPPNPHRVEKTQIPEVLRSLMNGMFRANFEKPEIQRDFEILQAAVLGHTPGLFAEFMGIVEETHGHMSSQGYFQTPEPDPTDVPVEEIRREIANLGLNLRIGSCFRLKPPTK